MDNSIVDKFMSDMLDMLKSAKDFAMEQLPLVAQEILKYNMVCNIAWMVLSIIVIGVYLFSFKKLVSMMNMRHTPNEALGTIGTIVGAAVTIGFTIALFSSMFELFKIVFAPRLYLLEYLEHLIRTVHH